MGCPESSRKAGVYPCIPEEGVGFPQKLLDLDPVPWFLPITCDYYTYKARKIGDILAVALELLIAAHLEHLFSTNISNQSRLREDREPSLI